MFKTGDRVVLDHKEGIYLKKRYGTIAAEPHEFYPSMSHCYLVLEDESGEKSYWYKGRTELAEIVDSPLFKALYEEDGN